MIIEKTKSLAMEIRFGIIFFILFVTGAQPCLSEVDVLKVEIHGRSYISKDNGAGWIRTNALVTEKLKCMEEESQLYIQMAELTLNEMMISSAICDADGDALSEMYVGEWSDSSIFRYEFDENLSYERTAVMDYGIPWSACDMNGDGKMELIVQRGDTGMGGKGYLDIHTWNDAGFQLMQRFTFPGMKMVYHPEVFDLNGNGLPEIIFTTMTTFSSDSYVRILEWNNDTQEMEIISSIQQQEAYGVIAAADFDRDGRGEFVVGGDETYHRYEFDNGAYVHKGPLGQMICSSDLALAWNAEGADDRRLILGTCLGAGQNNWRYEVFRSPQDDNFILEEVFTGTSEWIGNNCGGCLDADNDGKQELLLSFYPECRLYEKINDGFQSTWTFDQQSDTGTITTMKISGWDMNNDSYKNWILGDYNQKCFFYGYNNSMPQATRKKVNQNKIQLPAAGKTALSLILLSLTLYIKRSLS